MSLYRTTLLCRRCGQVYKVPLGAEKYGPWLCYVVVAPAPAELGKGHEVRCWTLNVWRG